MKKLPILIIAIIAVVAVTAFVISRNNQSTPVQQERIVVAASFYPLAEFTEKIGGEKVSVINIVPPGIESHDFEPTPQDIAKVYSANLFIFNGSGFDPWAEKIAPELERRGITVIHMTEHFDLLEGADEHEEEEGHEEEILDPHIWLDPVLAKRIVEIIRDALINADQDNSGVYAENAKQYLSKLSELDEKYREGLASCAIRDAVTSHAAFGYLAKRYNLNVIPIAGLSPEEEPSPRKIAEVAEFARQQNIKYIFFETLVSPKLAETIANEIGAQTLVFNPLEGLTDEELAAGKNYISVMEENLTNLRRALLCQ